MTRETRPQNEALRKQLDAMPINPKRLRAELPPWAEREASAEPYEKPKTAWQREMRERREKREGER